MPGLGYVPMGVGPYGYGSPSPAPSQPGQIYADASRGTVGTGREIDQATRQYVFAADGRVAGQDAVPQKVYLAYATVKGSSILASLGEEFTQIQTVGDAFTQTMTDAAIAPVQALIDSKELAIISVDVNRYGDDGSLIQIRWRDLTTGREGTTKL